ncbi:hypothetical protein RHGRI_019028 [Rhododendron griersonianum]|uniref:Late embryogenesis abundant protein LEA-2 subgroup domain-containing protein n=1 Tax=Rhododendron griersonianum TaxID=479676 RepID=A0AAV6JDI0_9ERIC|nr:hypothetical protein RHGRI_019028 [Rhododendron griersonianum]
MDEKAEIAPVNLYPRSTDGLESATMSYDDEIRRKKRRKRLVYIAAFAVFQTVVILVFALVVMRVRAPEVEIDSAAVEELSGGASSHYNMTIVARLKIKNKNFGDYKYERTAMNISHGGVTVGEGVILNGKAEARDTETVQVTARVSSVVASSNETSSGILVLESKAALRGKVHLMKMWGIHFPMMKKRKGAQMNCVMEINLASRVVQDMDCDD